MADKMTGFFCHDKYLEQTKRLSDEDLGKLFRACMIYHKDKVVVELDERLLMAFDFIKEDIDTTEDAYLKKCEQNRRNRLSTTDKQDEKAYDHDRPITTDNDRKQPSTTVTKEININNINKKEINKKVRFTPPTLDEVRAYCLERGNGIDPEYFIAYYANRNWELSNGKKMVNWKLAITTWEKNGFSSGRKVVSAQQYGQRDYSGEQGEAMKRMIERMNADAG